MEKFYARIGHFLFGFKCSVRLNILFLFYQKNNFFELNKKRTKTRASQFHTERKAAEMIPYANGFTVILQSSGTCSNPLKIAIRFYARIL